MNPWRRGRYAGTRDTLRTATDVPRHLAVLTTACLTLVLAGCDPSTFTVTARVTSIDRSEMCIDDVQPSDTPYLSCLKITRSSRIEGVREGACAEITFSNFENEVVTAEAAETDC